MDVTKDNFRKLLPHIEKQIEGADFFCIDGEFTGLSDGRRVNAFDTPTEYYETLRTSSMDFLLIQFGLSIFKWDRELKVFKHSGYNFYLFPGPSKNSASEIFFQCQSSSMSFLASQKFDFNKLFNEGISYLSTAEETQLKAKIEEKHLQDEELGSVKHSIQSYTNNHIPVPEEDKPQVSELCQSVRDFLKNDSLQHLELDVPNAFIRKLLYQEFETQFVNKLIAETVFNENNKRILKITKVRGEQDLKNILKEKHKKDWKSFADAVGFSAVVRKLSESGKLMVGHCLLLDLLHALHQFFAPLPENYESFKDFAHCTFPSILDTMYLAKIPEFKDMITSVGLESLLKTLSMDPFVMPPVVAENSECVKGYLLQNEKYHEAGYDAFTTGLCFLAMTSHLASQSNITMDQITLNSESNLLKPHINRIYLFKTSFQDSPFIHLGGREAVPTRSHVFHVTFPSNWKRSDLVDLFTPFGGVFTSFIDDCTAFVALNKRHLATKVLKTLRKNKTPYKILSFEDYKRKTTPNPYKYQKPVETAHANGTDLIPTTNEYIFYIFIILIAVVYFYIFSE